MSRNYVAINKDLEILLACEQISHPRTRDSPRRACWQAKKLPPHHSCVVHGDNLITRSAGNGRVDQFTLDVSLEKTVNKSQRPAGIIAVSDGHIFVLDC